MPREFAHRMRHMTYAERWARHLPRWRPARRSFACAGQTDDHRDRAVAGLAPMVKTNVSAVCSAVVCRGTAEPARPHFGPVLFCAVALNRDVWARRYEMTSAASV